MKKILILVWCLLAPVMISQAQTSFEIPQNITLKTPADFAKYESAVVDASMWLETTDLDKEVSKRQEVNSFLIQWISGSPTVTVDVTEALQKIYGENTQLLAIYLASYSRYIIQNKENGNKSGAIKAGLLSMISVYKKNIAIIKNKEMDKVIKLNDENKLDDFIKNKF